MRIIMEQDTQDIGANAEYLQRTPFIRNGERRRQALPRPSDAELQNEYNYMPHATMTEMSFRIWEDFFSHFQRGENGSVKFS